VSPRAQVKAQTVVAAQQGTTVIPETGQSVRPVNGHVEVQTDEGHSYHAERVLLATGGFSNTKQLLPRRLDIIVYARTIVLMEVDDTEVARLRGMPSLIYKPRDMNHRCYILPPIRYPDGKYYIKLGGGPHDHPLHSLEELQEWFRSKGSEKTEQQLIAILHAVIRDLRPLSMHTDTCVTTHTPTERPYVDKIAGGRVGVCIGGNGSAAKSADEIGRMGAEMIRHDHWTYDLEPDLFRVRFAED
jgi:sarcosine oxidase